MVSVIIPVYNGEKYISKCLDSLFASSANLSCLEVIAVNDGSKDSSSEILHEYEKKYSCIKVLDCENAGAAVARQRGFALATGEFVAFLDIDDYVESDMYARLEEKATASGADIVFCDFVEERPNSSNVMTNKLSDGITPPLTGIQALSELQKRRAIYPYPWNKIYRRELFANVKFPEGSFVGEDFNMLLQLFELTDKIEYLPFVGYHYMITENSVSRSGFTPKTVLAYEHYKKDFDFVCERHPELEREITNYLIIEYMAMIIAMGRNNNYDKPLIKEIKKFVRGGFFGFIFADYVQLKMKCSATALLISSKLLNFIYKRISK